MSKGELVCCLCLEATEARRAAEIAAGVHRLPSGRWIAARWNERHAQWESTSLPASSRKHVQGYVKSFARTLEQLAGVGVSTYATRAGAVRALGPAAPALCSRHEAERLEALARQCLDCGRDRVTAYHCAEHAALAATRDAEYDRVAREAEARREAALEAQLREGLEHELVFEQAEYEALVARRRARALADLRARAASASPAARAIAARRHARWVEKAAGHAERYAANPRPAELLDALRQDARALGLAPAADDLEGAAAALWVLCGGAAAEVRS
jgi:hypothetical protein